MYYSETAYRKGYAPAGQGGYGVIVGLVPKKKRLAKCEKMQYWYDKYIDATEKQRQLPSFLGIRAGAKNKKLRKQRKKYERYGKAAWRKCKQTGRNVKATQMREEEAGLAAEAADFAPPDLTLVPPPPPVGVDPMGMDPMAAAPPASQGPNLLLWGGVAGGGLLLLLLLRRKK